MNTTTTTTTTAADDLRVTAVTPRDRHMGSGFGAWVAGTVGAYRFEALVFAGPAADAAWGLPGSGGRVTKLWLTGRRDGRWAFGWDRGPGADGEYGAEVDAATRAAVARLAVELPAYVGR